MSAGPLVIAISTFFGCYAFVSMLAWFRAMARSGRASHVGHVVNLFGAFVPVIAGFVALVLVAAVAGIPHLVTGLIVLLPAGVALAFQLEVSRLVPAAPRVELLRLGCAGAMAGAFLLWRGIV